MNASESSIKVYINHELIYIMNRKDGLKRKELNRNQKIV